MGDKTDEQISEMFLVCDACKETRDEPSLKEEVEEVCGMEEEDSEKSEANEDKAFNLQISSFFGKHDMEQIGILTRRFDRSRMGHFDNGTSLTASNEKGTVKTSEDLIDKKEHCPQEFQEEVPDFEIQACCQSSSIKNAPNSEAL